MSDKNRRATDESKDYSKTAVQLITRYWRSYILDNDAHAAAQIMKAANYAGRAINISATTAAHAMSYKITSLYRLPHGHAVAVCLPEIWEYMISHPEKCIDPRGKEYMQNIFSLIQIEYVHRMNYLYLPTAAKHGIRFTINPTF